MIGHLKVHNHITFSMDHVLSCQQEVTSQFDNNEVIEGLDNPQCYQRSDTMLVLLVLCV